MTQKTGMTVGIALAIGVAIFAALMGNRSNDSRQKPIVDPICEPGFELVGEGCIPADEACELQGDSYRYDEATKECVNTAAPVQSQDTEIKVALLDTTGEGTGKSRGCDTVNMVTRVVRSTSMPLTAALQELFAMPEGSQPDTAYNFIARTKATLKFDRATITNGTANIYLTGSLSGLAGVCDDPRASIQLVETALQFPTVQNVQLYLNGEPTTLMPSEQ